MLTKIQKKMNSYPDEECRHNLSGKIMIFERNVKNETKRVTGTALDLFMDSVKEYYSMFQALDDEAERIALSEAIVNGLFMTMPNVVFLRINNSDWSALSTAQAAGITSTILRNGRIKLMTLSSSSSLLDDTTTTTDDCFLHDDLESGGWYYSSLPMDADPIIVDYRSYTPF